MTTIDIVEAWNGPGLQDGTITAVRPQDNAIHPSDSKLAFEHWYFDAHLDDGHIVVAFLQTRELIRRKPGIELHIYAPDGTRREIVQGFSDSDVTASADHCDVTIGGNNAHVEFRDGALPLHHVHIAAEDVSFDLVFENLLPSWMPGKGQTSYGTEDYFAWCVGAPRAAVTGTVTIGDTTLDATGRGYADHNWGVGDMKRIIDNWYWGRLYTDDFSLIYANVVTQKKYGGHVSRPLMLAYKGEVVLSTGEVQLTEGPKVFDTVANRTYPSWIRLHVPGQVDLRLTVQSVVHAHDYIEDLPVVRSMFLKPVVNRLLGRPGYFRFDSLFELSVTRDGETVTSTGSTLHEMVALK